MSAGEFTLSWESMDKDRLKSLLSKKPLLKPCVDALYKNDIDGEVLLLLSESDLENIGLTLGQRKLIMKLISSPPTKLIGNRESTKQPSSSNWPSKGTQVTVPQKSNYEKAKILQLDLKKGDLNQRTLKSFTVCHQQLSHHAITYDYEAGMEYGTGPQSVHVDEDDLSARIWVPEDPNIADGDDWLIICNLEYPGISRTGVLEVLLRESSYEVDSNSIKQDYCRAYFRGRGPITVKGYDQIRTFSHKLRAFKHNYVVNVPSRAFSEPMPRWPRNLLFLVWHDPRLRKPDPIIKHMQNGGHSSKCIAAMIRLASNKTVVALYKTPKYFRRLPLVNRSRLIRKITLPTDEEMACFRGLFKNTRKTPPPDIELKQEAPVSQETNPVSSPSGSPPVKKKEPPIINEDKHVTSPEQRSSDEVESLVHDPWPLNAGEGGLALNPSNLAQTMQVFTSQAGIMKMERPAAYQPSLSPILGSCGSDSASTRSSSRSPRSSPESDIPSENSADTRSRHLYQNADKPSQSALNRLKSSTVYYQEAQEAHLEQEEKSLDSSDDPESTPTHATLSQKFLLNWFSLS